MSDEERRDVGQLLSFLEEFEAVAAVRDRFARSGNVVPAILLESCMKRVQKLLDERK